ncbi:unnamed protein product [Pedinophyceae sp. YPF-701]|nr:unnamed protein product [Pedinophyceae sp. YPF-701]
MAATLAENGTPEEQAYLSDATANVRRHAFFMRKAMDENNIREALRYAAAMLGELRTQALGPQRYFELYMSVFDELRELERFFRDCVGRGHSHASLFEMVQYAGNVLPRLYLMCTVGAVYITSGEVRARDVAQDLIEMCKGVQHPMRGLFLRNYLCQMVKGRLPGAQAGASDEETTDAIELILGSFVEMNKLWVRMQHQYASTTPGAAEACARDRLHLQDLVGRNLGMLAQVESMGLQRYCDDVLPRLLHQVVACQDALAQAYLMEGIVQAFPDEHHLQTLGQLLDAMGKLQPGVALHRTTGSLLKRLATYAQTSPAALSALQRAGALETLEDAVSKATHVKPADSAQGSESSPSKATPPAPAQLAPRDLAALNLALAQLVAAVKPGDSGRTDAIFASVSDALRGRTLSSEAEAAVRELLTHGVATFGLAGALSLPHFGHLQALLSYPRRHELALATCKDIVAKKARITSDRELQELFEFVAPVLVDAPEGTDGAVSAAARDGTMGFEEEQGTIAQLIGLLDAPESGAQLAMLRTAYGHLRRGGGQRMKHTLEPLTHAVLKVVRTRSSGGELDVPAALRLAMEVAATAADVAGPHQARRVLVDMVAAIGDGARLGVPTDETSWAVCDEALRRALRLYETSVGSSAGRLRCVTETAEVLAACAGMPHALRAPLVEAVRAHAALILPWEDRCRALLACAHMFWCTGGASAGGGVRDAKGVAECLDRAKELARAARRQLDLAGRTDDATPAQLWVDILDAAVEWEENGCGDEAHADVAGVLEECRKACSTPGAQANEGLQRHFKAVKRYIGQLQSSSENLELAQRFAGLKID